MTEQAPAVPDGAEYQYRKELIFTRKTQRQLAFLKRLDQSDGDTGVVKTDVGAVRDAIDLTHQLIKSYKEGTLPDLSGILLNRYGFPNVHLQEQDQPTLVDPNVDFEASRPGGGIIRKQVVFNQQTKEQVTFLKRAMDTTVESRVINDAIDLAWHLIDSYKNRGRIANLNNIIPGRYGLPEINPSEQ